jgi:hypothetical protein
MYPLPENTSNLHPATSMKLIFWWFSLDLNAGNGIQISLHTATLKGVQHRRGSENCRISVWQASMHR